MSSLASWCSLARSLETIKDRHIAIWMHRLWFCPSLDYIFVLKFVSIIASMILKMNWSFEYLSLTLNSLVGNMEVTFIHKLKFPKKKYLQFCIRSYIEYTLQFLHFEKIFRTVAAFPRPLEQLRSQLLAKWLFNLTVHIGSKRVNMQTFPTKKGPTTSINSILVQQVTHTVRYNIQQLLA